MSEISENLDRLEKILDGLTQSSHGEDCAAHGKNPDADVEDIETEIDDNPSDFLEHCDCGLKDAFEAWEIAKSLRTPVAPPGAPNGLMDALDAAIADGKHVEGCKFETTCTCWLAKVRDVRTKLRKALFDNDPAATAPLDPDWTVDRESPPPGINGDLWRSLHDLCRIVRSTSGESILTTLTAYLDGSLDDSGLKLNLAHPVPAPPAVPVDALARIGALSPSQSTRPICPIHGQKYMHGDTLICKECGKLIDGPHPGSASTGATIKQQPKEI